MRRFTRFYCCAALALGLVSSHSMAGPLGSAASDAFRRLPQSAPTAANTSNPATTAAPNSGGDTGGVVVQSTNAPAGPIDLLPDSANPLPPEPPTYGENSPLGGATNGGGVRNDVPSRVPEPGVLWLLGAGVLGLALARRRRK